MTSRTQRLPAPRFASPTAAGAGSGGRWSDMPPWERPVALGLLALVLGVALFRVEFFAVDRWGRAGGNLTSFIAGFWPPDFVPAGELGLALLETLAMALVGTCFGAALALPLGVLAARNLFRPATTGVARFVLSTVRTIPSLVWALVFVVAVGLGPLPGALALTVYTLGYLGKLFAEAFEGVDPEVHEAVAATGASRWQVIRWAVVPEAMNSVLSQGLFMFEYNVRSSAILGFVGAGGIGFYMMQYFAVLAYNALCAAVLLMLVLVLALDAVSGAVRRRYLGTAGGS